MIKITHTNAAQVDAALLAANGKATAHTYTTYAEISALAAEAEARVVKLVGKSRAVGAKFTATSGGQVNNSYARKSYVRDATRVVMERRTSGWYLVSASRVKIFQQGGGTTLWLTTEQDAYAVERFRQQYVRFEPAPVVHAIDQSHDSGQYKAKTARAAIIEAEAQAAETGGAA